jgi:hypothetical protein
LQNFEKSGTKEKKSEESEERYKCDMLLLLTSKINKKHTITEFIQNLTYVCHRDVNSRNRKHGAAPEIEPTKLPVL